MHKVNQNYIDMKEDSMFDKIKRQEEDKRKVEEEKQRTNSQDQTSLKTVTSSARTKSGMVLGVIIESKKDEGYGGSNLNAPKYKDGKAVEERPVPQASQGVCS